MKRTAGLELTSIAVMALTLALAGLTAAQSQTPAAPAAKAQNSATQPAGRAPVQAKTQEEYQAYQAAVANAQNPAAMEKSADDFAAKFPSSDLRVLLYRAAMQSYLRAGDSPKMLNMGLKVLAINKDDPETLISVAGVLAETSTADLDKDQRMNQAVTYSQHALETIDTDLAVPAGIPPQKVEAYKKNLRATAFAIIGTVQYKREQYADAEGNLRKSIDADVDNPDPWVILQLAVVLDQQTKYPEALQQANRAVGLTQENTDTGKMARNERDRLVLMTEGSNPTAPAPPSAGSQAPAPPSH